MNIKTFTCVWVFWNEVLRTESRLRVHDGFDVSHEKYPYVIAFGNSRIFRSCTGSLISPIWVLSAAHCINPEDPGQYIMYGDLTRINATLFGKIRQKFNHPLYNAVVKIDIGLVLVEKVSISTFGKVSAVDYTTMVGLPVTYMGYGASYNQFKMRKEDLLTISEDKKRPLQMGEAVVVSCEEVIHNKRSSICLRPKCSNKNQLVRGGDSGGPLFYAGKIIGVACCILGLNYTDVKYTAVSPHLDWINDIMSSSHL